jgi:hypothetical protein
MFLENKDADIANIVWNYFDAVKERWPEAWVAGGRGSMLNKTNGFRALMRFLRPAYRHIAMPGSVVKTDQFLTLFKKVTLRNDEFSTDNFKPGTSGETTLYYRLIGDTEIITR